MAFKNYIEKGDLADIRKRGTLRLLAPVGISEESLPRDGLPGSTWRELAEKFARSRGLQPQWVYVQSFADLIPALREGRGDIIAINFTRTKQRAEQVAFTRPLQYVRELLVTRTDAQRAESGQPVQVALRRGSAFAHALAGGSENAVATEQAGRFEIRYLDEPADYDSLLGGVASGKYPATVVDSNLADALLPFYPELAVSETLNSKRAIAWAVRKQAPVLVQSLNEFLTGEHLIAEQMQERPLRDWAQIKESRTLRVLTRNHPASYFMWKGELMGFDYDLLRKFAEEQGLRLSMVVPGPDVDLGEALNAGLGDMIAASLTVTEARREQGLSFTRPYMEVQEQVIAAKAVNGADNTDIAGMLTGAKVAVNPLTSYYDNLDQLALQQNQPLEIVAVEGATTEYLIEAVANGEYPFTVADSHLVAIERTYRDDFTVIGNLAGKQQIAWAVRNQQPDLLKKLNGFLNAKYRGLFFNVTYNKYFKESKRIEAPLQERLRSASKLSPYDPIVKEYAAKMNRDWRMIVAQMYQESRFDPKARSFAGARGLMQVLPRTARQMGITDLYQPENNIRAGISYLQWLEDRFPKRLEFDERIYFTLAAYNAGHGHVRDARKLAQSLGKDPDRWFGNVEEAMLLLSKPEYYRKARFGYVRGREPVNYVREIRNRYLGYLSVARKERLENQPQ
ncbi:transporter substrate-binding domain-containing protein [Microbulbifer aestuariivivens]|uniref:transporter substrate-binding domain-containing protein n=1 Tax=Microbulbifer aestuariivivens TaxID=1908308 RepID=UPI0031EE8F5C